MFATEQKVKMLRNRYTENYGTMGMALSPRIRGALLAELVLGIVTAQESKVHPDDVHNLLMSVRKAVNDLHGEGYV